MAFVELFPSKPKVAAKAPVRIGMTKPRDARARMTLLLDAEVLAKLGGRAERYRLRLGSVENKHEIEIVQDDQGPFEATRAGKADSSIRRLRLPIVEQFPDCVITPEEARHKISPVQKNALVVTLPAWAWDANARKQREKAGRM